MSREAKPSGPLGEFEELILLAVLRHGQNAYGRPIRDEIEARTGRKVSISAVYTTLERLTAKEYLACRISEPTARRGGRRKKFYSLQPPGGQALRESYRSYRSMIRGLEERLESL